MALPDKILVQVGTTVTFRDTGGDVTLSLANLPNSTSESTGARQSAKVDLGATRSRFYEVRANLDFQSAPTAGNAVQLWWSPSGSATAGTDNTGGASGADGAYTGDASANITNSLRHCQFIGLHTCTATPTTTVQKSVVGAFRPLNRYGSLIVWNKSGIALVNATTNHKVVFTPIEDVVID